MLRPLWVKGGCAARLSTSTLFPQQVLRTNNFNGLRVKRSSAAALNRKGFLGHCQNAARHTNIYGPRSDRRASLLVERQSGGSGKARQVESAKPVKMDFTITPPFLADCRYRHWPRKRQQPGCEPQSWSHCVGTADAPVTSRWRVVGRCHSGHSRAPTREIPRSSIADAAAFGCLRLASRPRFRASPLPDGAARRL